MVLDAQADLAAAILWGFLYRDSYGQWSLFFPIFVYGLIFHVRMLHSIYRRYVDGSNWLTDNYLINIRKYIHNNIKNQENHFCFRSTKRITNLNI